MGIEPSPAEIAQRLHTFRNSLDHGIESNEERQALGKAPRGKIALRTERDPDGVRIRLSDDGSGLPLAELRTKTGRHDSPDDAVARRSSTTASPPRARSRPYRGAASAWMQCSASCVSAAATWRSSSRAMLARAFGPSSSCSACRAARPSRRERRANVVIERRLGARASVVARF
jgi:hypothetical protein